MNDKFIKELSTYYNWLEEYCKMVFFEYERILELRNLNNELNPSIDIEKCWIFHILNTEYYYKYCMLKFNKIIHFKPYIIEYKVNKIDIKCIKNTIKEYKQKFIVKYPLVWNIK
jgi:hypothetical protein